MAATDDDFRDLIEALREENPGEFVRVCAHFFPEMVRKTILEMLDAEAAQDGPQSREDGR
jgi:hypothetical protein